jgi:hypothetical protein
MKPWQRGRNLRHTTAADAAKREKEGRREESSTAAESVSLSLSLFVERWSFDGSVTPTEGIRLDA